MSQDNRGREQLLESLEQEARRAGWRGVFDEAWREWDVMLCSDRWFSAELTTATEELGWPNRFTRARVTMKLTLLAKIRLAALAVASTAACVWANGHPWALAAVAAVLAIVGAALWVKRRRALRAVEVLLARAGRLADLPAFVAEPKQSLWAKALRYVRSTLAPQTEEEELEPAEAFAP